MKPIAGRHSPPLTAGSFDAVTLRPSYSKMRSPGLPGQGCLARRFGAWLDSDFLDLKIPGIFLRFAENRRHELLDVCKAVGFFNLAVFRLQFIHGTGIQCPRAAALNACRLGALRPAIDAEITLLHLTVLLGTELRRVIGTDLKALSAIIFAQAGLTVHRYNPVFIPFRDGINRANGYAGRIQAVMTGHKKMGDEKLGEFSLFGRL
jgi:hypothetical protein